MGIKTAKLMIVIRAKNLAASLWKTMKRATSVPQISFKSLSSMLLKTASQSSNPLGLSSKATVLLSELSSSNRLLWSLNFCKIESFTIILWHEIWLTILSKSKNLVSCLSPWCFSWKKLFVLDVCFQLFLFELLRRVLDQSRLLDLNAGNPLWRKEGQFTLP